MSAPKKRKGLSLDEKRDVIQSLFFSSKDVFNLKDIEKLGAKEGVVQQTIKDVLQSLVDDKIVEVDKIGSGNFYWAFPSKAFLSMTARAEELAARAASEEAACAELDAKVAELSAGREDSVRGAAKSARKPAMRLTPLLFPAPPDGSPSMIRPRTMLQAGRAEKLVQLASLKADREDLETRLKQFADSDPDALKEMQIKAGIAKKCSDRCVRTTSACTRLSIECCLIEACVRLFAGGLTMCGHLRST